MEKRSRKPTMKAEENARVQANKKMKDGPVKRFITDSDNCNGCNEYVEEGVGCMGCKSWYHYDCAGTTYKEVAKLGNKQFYCKQHSENNSGNERRNVLNFNTK